MMGEQDYAIANAMIEIEDMIAGEENGLSPDPSIYSLARETRQCERSLFEYISDMLVEGTALRMVAFDNRGVNPPSGVYDDLARRLALNAEMYEKYCGECLSNLSIVRGSQKILYMVKSGQKFTSD